MARGDISLRPVPTVETRAIAWLGDHDARDPSVAGAKASNLARAAAGHIPVLPAFVLTTGGASGGHVVPDAQDQLRSAWRALTASASGPLVVRSSSTAEDTGASSMAGQFTSVLGAETWNDFVAAIDTVLASAAHPHDGSTTARPMAVLVQPQLDTECSGVLFGLEPVTGDLHRFVVEAVAGTPDALVSGTVTGTHCTLSRRGRLVGGGGPAADALLPRHRRRRLARLARRAASAFGEPQDIEWAFDREDHLWLLQSRPVTARGDAVLAAGPFLGPGPVSETFPEPLRPLEADLWVGPLRDGIVRALEITAAASARRVAASPVVTTVGGRVAADLELLGVTPHGHSVRALLNPFRGGRRLVAAWRVGRLRAALSGLATDLVDHVDAALAAVPSLSELDDHSLVVLLDRGGQELTALHGYEVLAGMLTRGTGDRATAAALALDAVRRQRELGAGDAEIIAREPVALALVPPAIGRPATLPEVPGRPLADQGVTEELGPREALRLRCRWVQELSARAADELGRRLHAAGTLDAPELVQEMTLPELVEAIDYGVVADDLVDRAQMPAGPPLPARFRLSPAGQPVSVRDSSSATGNGLAAGGGRATGTACHGTTRGAGPGPYVLIVGTLDPRLAAELPNLAGLVSETGSALSHLAVLAREAGVPTVVAVPDARKRFPAGRRLLVDGTTGELQLVERLPREEVT